MSGSRGEYIYIHNKVTGPGTDHLYFSSGCSIREQVESHSQSRTWWTFGSWKDDASIKPLFVASTCRGRQMLLLSEFKHRCQKFQLARSKSKLTVTYSCPTMTRPSQTNPKIVFLRLPIRFRMAMKRSEQQRPEEANPADSCVPRKTNGANGSERH